jgi:hypothetical protein
MVEITRDSVEASASIVHGDFKPVNVGGVLIEDRGRLRRYLKENNLAPHDPEAVKRARDRIAKQEAATRKQAVINAYEHVRNQERSKQRFG